MLCVIIVQFFKRLPRSKFLAIVKKDDRPCAYVMCINFNCRDLLATILWLN